MLLNTKNKIVYEFDAAFAVGFSLPVFPAIPKANEIGHVKHFHSGRKKSRPCALEFIPFLRSGYKSSYGHNTTLLRTARIKVGREQSYIKPLSISRIHYPRQ